MSKHIVDLIAEGKLVEAQVELNEAITDRAADFLVEKRKEIVAKTFPSGSKVKPKEKGNEKAILDKSKKKALKDKMAKVKQKGK